MSEPVAGVPATAIPGLGRVGMSPLTTGFWQAATNGRLVSQQCLECGVRRHPPSAACCRCQSQRWDWVELAGNGTVFSFVWVDSPITAAFAAVIPYNVCLIDVDVDVDGRALRMYGNVTEVDKDSLRIGLAVEVHFVELDGGATLPVFRPRFEPRRTA